MKLKYLPVGALVKDTKTKYNGEVIIWQVLEHGHTGDPANSTTLCSRDIITLKPFDAMETTNPESAYNYGNNRYSLSNILQWLNSDASAGTWYSAKHAYDQPPDASHIGPTYDGGGTAYYYNAYDTEAGFLKNFSKFLKNSLMEVSKPTALNTAVESGGIENVVSKVFLLSETELGYTVGTPGVEGSVYSYYNTEDAQNLRKKNLANEAAKGDCNIATSPWYWRTRSVVASTGYGVTHVYTSGGKSNTYVSAGHIGVAPAFCISQDTDVSDTPDTDGVYKIIGIPTVKKIYVGDSNNVSKLLWKESRTMTARFNLSDSNPSTWGEYLDDAVDMTVGSSAWDEFFGHYPALIKNGAIVGKLDPTQGYAKFIDGTAADITSGADGDVMIIFPRRDLKIWKDSGYIYVSMTEDLNKSGYTHYAHSYKSTPCDYFALGRYKGYYDGSKLRSLSGKTPTVNINLSTSRSYARNNGTGYEQSAHFQLTYRQAMYMLKYKGQNSQIAIGRGYSDGNSASIATGGSNSHSMDWGENTGKYQMSFLGIEDFWGNVCEWVDGIYSDGSKNVSVSDGNFSDSGSGYTSVGNTFKTDFNSYPSDCQCTNLSGFIPSSAAGSSSTYFCDHMALLKNCGAYAGGTWSNGDYSGVFRYDIGLSPTTTPNTMFGARLMYMHTA